MPATTTTSTPNPPGIRAQAFQTLHAKTLTKTLSLISYENFSQCFPTIRDSSPAALRTLHAQFTERLETFAHKEFAAICEERGVVAALDELDRLCAEAKQRRDAEGAAAAAAQGGVTAAGAEGSAGSQAGDEAQQLAARRSRSNGVGVSAAELVAAHLVSQWRMQQSALNARVQTVQSLNAKVWEEISAQRREIDALLGNVAAGVADLERAVEVLEGADGRDGGGFALRGVVRGVDEEMAAIS